MKKLAFIFMIYNSINYEYLWNNFFAETDKEQYTIYIYSQKMAKLDFFENHRVQGIQTKYRDISIVKNQNLLLKHALKDPQNTHFIFLSGTCVPIKTFKYIYQFLDGSFSYFNKAPLYQSSYFAQKLSDDKNICIEKASQWNILHRKHASFLVNNTDYLTWFQEINIAPDEYCYISKLYTAGFDKEIIITNNVSYGATTFANWSDIPYKFSLGHKGLKNYNYIHTQEINYLLHSPSLFARKFLKECLLENNQTLSDYISYYLKNNNE